MHFWVAYEITWAPSWAHGSGEVERGRAQAGSMVWQFLFVSDHSAQAESE